MTIRAHIIGFEGGTISNFDSPTGSVSASSAAARSGNYGMLCDATSAAAYGTYAVTSTTYYDVGRFYFRIPTLPSSDMRIASLYSSSTNSYNIDFRASDGVLTLSGYASGVLQETVDGPNLAANEWTRIDYRIATGSLGTRTMAWMINGISPPDQLVGNAGYAGAIQNVRLGHSIGALANGIIHFDDFVHINNTGAAENADMLTFYPIGPGYVKKLAVSGVGQHYLPQYFRASSGTLQDSWSLLTELPADSVTTYVEQILIHTGAYLEYIFEDLTTPLWNGFSPGNATPQIVSGICPWIRGTSNGLNSNDFKVYLIDSLYTTTYYSGLWISSGWRMENEPSMPVNGDTQHWNVLNPWTAERINSMKARVGFSDDVNGIPQLASMWLELSILEAEDYKKPVQGRTAVPWVKA